MTTKRLEGGVPHVLPGSKCHSFVWKKVQELLLKARRAKNKQDNRNADYLTRRSYNGEKEGRLETYLQMLKGRQ